MLNIVNFNNEMLSDKMVHRMDKKCDIFLQHLIVAYE